MRETDLCLKNLVWTYMLHVERKTHNMNKFIVIHWNQLDQFMPNKIPSIVIAPTCPTPSNFPRPIKLP
jgi:hypothetical protein